MTMDDQTKLLVMNHDQFFVLTDSVTNQPLADWRYRLSWGHQTVEGVTDALGQTQNVAAPNKSDVTIEALGLNTAT